MDGRERVVGALKRTSSCPAWIELSVHPRVFSALSGEPVDDRFGSGYFAFRDADGGTKAYEKTLAIVAECSRNIHLDAMGCKYWTPSLGELKRKAGMPTRTEVAAAIRKIRSQIDSDNYYTCGRILLDVAHAHGLAGFFSLHFLMHPIIDGCLGLERFSYALYDQPEMIRYMCEAFAEYTIAHIRNMMQLKPDFLWVGDDFAFKQGPYMSPDMWAEFIMPCYERIASEIKCPWVYHSDGNILPMMDYLLPLGMSALHPIEPGAVDIRFLKETYGQQVALVGNLDMRVIQTGTEKDVSNEVEWLYRDIGVGGGWLLSSSNAIDAAARPANVRAMGNTLARLRAEIR